MDLKRITWDYENPLEDELWRARRMAEFFPFVAGDLTREDKNLILRYLDQIKLPDERKAIIRIVCSAEKILTEKEELLISRLPEERFEMKGLDFVIPERLLPIAKLRSEDLPVMIEELSVGEMKQFFFQEAKRLVKRRTGSPLSVC
jgi:hypothetical protein